MSTDESTPIEPLSTWLDGKPYWEQHVWDLCSKYGSLTDEQHTGCCQLLYEDVGLAPRNGMREPLAFEDLSVALPFPAKPTRIFIGCIKDFHNVNALCPDCLLPVGQGLTLVFGRNGTGKSGIARLLANACFARGRREVLPNFNDATLPTGPASATFELLDAAGTLLRTAHFEMGRSDQDLRRFSVFDRQSVLIHLNEPNRVHFVPPFIVIFDRVATAVARIENQVAHDRSSRRRENPYFAMFSNTAEVTEVSTFCKSLSAVVTDDQLDAYASFDEAIEGKRIEQLESDIAALRRLDVSTKRSQLLAEADSLDALRSTLESALAHFSRDESTEINCLIADLAAQHAIAERLGAKSVDDGIFQTVGSAEWKGFIKAAKALYENEKQALSGKDPTHCLLCHQSLDARAVALHEKYWQFLAGEAETELSRLVARQSGVLESLRTLRIRFPAFPETDSGVKVLGATDPTYLARLSKAFGDVAQTLDEWIRLLGGSEEVGECDLSRVDLQGLRSLAKSKRDEASALTDPTDQISTLAAKLLYLNHKKAASAVKDKANEYLEYARWTSRIERVNFAGIKAVLTKRRTETFLVGVLNEYMSTFNSEMADLGSEFNLEMLTSGEQGRTVREYRLRYAEDQAPSDVLSEGEQNVCALADFLTETQLDPNNCGIILDDPVSSLDHERKTQM